MAIKNLNEINIIKNKNINSKFLSVSLKNLNLTSKIYKGDFYLDSFNYFPITDENYSFLDLFRWKINSTYDHFFTKKFYSNFEKDKKNFKVINDVVVLGSSPGNNYFRNLVTFIPRIILISDKQINIAIHRKSSNKFRNFIEHVLKNRGVKLKKFIYLDDDFYFFKNSQIPQFHSEGVAIRILNKIFKTNFENKHRIYLTRKNAHTRRLINESDLIEELKLKNFKIIDPETLNINEQIDVFSSAEIIVSPTGSALANIVFCHKGTKIFEITPKYQFQYEHDWKSRYSHICSLLGFEYYSLEADSISIDEVDENTKKFVNINVINQSNYYKNLIVKKNNFKKFISQI